MKRETEIIYNNYGENVGEGFVILEIGRIVEGRFTKSYSRKWVEFIHYWCVKTGKYLGEREAKK